MTRTEVRTTGTSKEAARGVPRAAFAFAVGSWTLALVSLLLFFTSWTSANRPVEDWLFLLVDAMVAGVYGTVAAVILARRRHLVAVLLALAAVGGGLSAFGGAWQQAVAVRGLPDLEAVTLLYGTAWVPGTLALFLVVPWLVRDHPLGRARWGAIVGAVLSVAALAVQFLFGEAFEPLLVVLVLAVLFGVVTAASVAHRWRRGPVAERNGLGWLSVGTAVMAVSFVPLVLPFGSLPSWITPALHLACQGLFPAAILAVVLRSRLWGLELAVSRAVLAGTLTLALVAAYVVVTVAVGRVIGGTELTQIVAAAVVVVAVQPSRLWLQRRVSRLVYGEAHDPWAVAGRLGSQLGRMSRTDELLQSLVDSVGGALRLESVTLVSQDRPVAAWGAATSTPVEVPLRHGDERIGSLLATTPPGETLGPRARRALEELGAVVASGLALARTVWALESTRDHLTRARLAERRVIRRELHDGLGPWLSGLRLGLQGVRNLIRTDPAQAEQMLGLLQAELDQRIEDVRTVARNLLPPVLDELGLAAALTELAGRHAQTGFEVDLDCDALDDLPEQVAAAAYGIASEAVINAARHSQARSCRLDVRVVDGVLTVRCTDAGVGPDPDAPSGVGTRSMRERAEEQGGTYSLRALSPHGTEVVAQLPLRREVLR